MTEGGGVRSAQRRVVRAWSASGGRFSRIVLLTCVLLLVLAAALDPGMTVLGQALQLLLILVAIAVHVVVHETAHALMALALRMSVPEVELGAGHPLIRLRIGSTTIKIGGFHAGTTHVEPQSSRWVRMRLAAVMAAGPTSNLGLAAATFWIFEPPLRDLGSFTGSLVLTGLLTGLFNLLPLRIQTSDGRAETDGRALLSLLSADRRFGEQVVAVSRLGAAQRQHRAGVVVAPDTAGRPVDRSDPVVLGTEGTRRIFTGEYADAVALLREAVAMPQDEETRALSLNNLAWALVLSRPEGWLEEADSTSAAAISVLPSREAMMSTRGCVLVDLGEYAEARPLLRQALTTEMASRDRVILCSHLLRAEQGLGNLYGAREALLDMIDAGAGSEEIAFHRALLRSAEVDNALTHLLDADGVIRWPHAGKSRDFARHLDEMRSVLTAFVTEGGEDPRREAVRLALGH